jgi:hypothetical protein
MGSRALRRVTLGASSLALATLVAVGGTSLPALASADTARAGTVLSNTGVAGTAGVEAGTPPDPKLALAVAEWVANGGETDLTTLATDFKDLSTAADSEDMASIGDSCTQLQSDIESAQAYDPIPDPQAQQAWASALAEYARGATDCIAGATASTPDVNLITKASAEITTGSKDLDLVTTRLNAIAG